MSPFHFLRGWISDRPASASDPGIDEAEVHDLLFLQEQLCIRVVASGRSITRLETRLTNLLKTPLDVAIEPGTYFVAKGAYQDMVVIDKVHVRLPALGSRDLTLRVACMCAKE